MPTGTGSGTPAVVASTLVGYVVQVEPNGFTASLLQDEQGLPATVTIGDEDILVGQVGSYLAVKQSGMEIVGIATEMSEQEKFAPASQEGSVNVQIPYAQRTLRITPLGTINDDGQFERGVSIFPTTGAEVHVIGSDTIRKMFSKYEEQGFNVGVLSANPTTSVFLNATTLFGRHFAVLGQTGAGKSWTVATLVQRAVAEMPLAHIVILDVHGEYCWTEGRKKRFSFADNVVRHVDARELEIPYWLMTYAELCDHLIDRTEQSAHNQAAVFREALNQLRSEEGQALKLPRTTVDTPVFFDLPKLRAYVESKNGLVPSETTGKMIKGPLTGAFDNFLMRLDSRLNDVRYDFLFKPRLRKSSSSMSELLRDFIGLGKPKRPITIIDLSGVPFDVRPTVAAQIGRLAFEFNYWNPIYRDFPILLICEESHAYIPRERESQFSGSRRSMERIAKEGRKYGVGLGVVSQRPHEVSETVLAQCGTFFCLRITNPDDQAYIRSLVPEAERDLMDIIAGLGRGEAVALGEAVPIPSRFKFYPPDPSPHSDDIDFYEKWRNGPTDLDVEEIVSRWRRQERSLAPSS